MNFSLCKYSARQHFYWEVGQTLEQASQRGSGASSCRGVQNSNSPGQPDPADLALSVGLGLEHLQMFCWPQLFSDSKILSSIYSGQISNEWLDIWQNSIYVASYKPLHLKSNPKPKRSGGLIIGQGISSTTQGCLPEREKSEPLYYF